MRGQEEFIPTPSWSLGLELWSCHVLLFPVFFLLFITHSFHLGLHVSLFSSIYKMIPPEEWCLCLEYQQQQHGWFVLGALVGRQMDRTTCRHGSNPFIQRGRFVPIRRWDDSHQELNACSQTSHSSRASDNLWQCWKLSQQQLRCSRWRQSDWFNSLWSTVIVSLSETLKSEVFLKLHLWCFSPWPSPLVHQPECGGDFKLEGFFLIYFKIHAFKL